MVDEATSCKPFTAARDGFSINAAVGCEARERGKLERLCRYMARPPIAEERLSVDGDGLVVYELKHAFSDDTTHVLFECQDFIARLAALVPRPRVHLIRYHGLFAPNAHGCAGAAKHMAGIVPDNPLHSRHCTWMCRCREAQDVRERPSMAVRCARAAVCP